DDPQTEVQHLADQTAGRGRYLPFGVEREFRRDQRKRRGLAGQLALEGSLLQREFVDEGGRQGVVTGRYLVPELDDRVGWERVAAQAEHRLNVVLLLEDHLAAGVGQLQGHLAIGASVLPETGPVDREAKKDLIAGINVQALAFRSQRAVSGLDVSQFKPSLG